MPEIKKYEGKVDKILDASGLDCPLPLLKMKLSLNEMLPGEKLQVIATDRGSEKDFKAFCDMSQHQLLGFCHENDQLIFHIEKGES